MTIRIASSRFYIGIIPPRTVSNRPRRDVSIMSTRNGAASGEVGPTTMSLVGRRVKSSIGLSGRFAEKRADAVVASASPSSSSSSSSRAESVPLGYTSMAMGLAVATVSAVACLVERATSANVPDFDPNGQRYDQSTYVGRLSRMLLACDPSLVLYGDDEVRRCRAMVDEYELHPTDPPTGGITVAEMNRRLWEAQRVASSALHPDTGEIIPRPFRMSGYVPFNGPICVAMVASQSTSALLFWSWANQSQNALVNYYNRNASSEMSNETLLTSYGAAVAAALGVAFGLATIVRRRYDPTRARDMMRYVAFPSAVVASSMNCYIVRSPEIDTGVPLVNADGMDVLPNETSRIAAERGVNSTTLSRALLQAPVYFLPPFMMGAIAPLKNAIASNPAMRVPMTTYLLLVCFGIGLPASVAIFPQMGEIRVEDAEEKYRHLPDDRSDGKPYEVLYYNKGL
ncbi:hypothetical protein ACHAXA_009353 [Cyclostephanos tholiformis]|uniref:Uncharacterized protein n=1 Tax=Cyclostephanos tholiformis TaxID=382380 RepID=A0ABD3SQ68_9STRA